VNHVLNRDHVNINVFVRQNFLVLIFNHGKRFWRS